MPCAMARRCMSDIPPAVEEIFPEVYQLQTPAGGISLYTDWPWFITLLNFDRVYMLASSPGRGSWYTLIAIARFVQCAMSKKITCQWHYG